MGILKDIFAQAVNEDDLHADILIDDGEGDISESLEPSQDLRDLLESLDSTGHEHAADGKFGKGGAKKTADTKPGKETKIDFTPDALHAKAAEIAESEGAKSSTLLAKFKAPAKWLKDKTDHYRGELTKKYGVKGAAAIFAAGQVITWGITIGAPIATGLPIVVPPGGGLLTSLALAGMVEAYKTVTGKKPKDELKEAAEVEPSEREIEQEAVALVNEILQGLGEMPEVAEGE